VRPSWDNRIARAYDEQSVDKTHAVSEILNVRDYSAFLGQSRYAEQGQTWP
jgi:hypothetical protein